MEQQNKCPKCGNSSNVWRMDYSINKWICAKCFNKILREKSEKRL